MRAYVKFVVLALSAVALQLLIERNSYAVEDAVFALHCASVNLFGTQAERDGLLNDASQLLDRQRQRFFEELLVQFPQGELHCVSLASQGPPRVMDLPLPHDADERDLGHEELPVCMVQ